MLDKSGVCPDPAKVKAIQGMPIPKNVSDVCRFLGMVNQFGKLSPNLAEKPNRFKNCSERTMHGCEAQHVRHLTKSRRL